MLCAIIRRWISSLGKKLAVHTVLIIEDSQELAEIIQFTLEDMNIKTHHESHGKRGLDAFQKIKPDLVLLDIGLPDMRGWKVLDELRSLEETTPRVIVITAFDDPANRLMGRLQGVADYLVKPFTPDEIEDKVSLALGLKEDKALPEAEKGSIDPMQEVMGLISEAEKIIGVDPEKKTTEVAEPAKTEETLQTESASLDKPTAEIKAQEQSDERADAPADKTDKPAKAAAPKLAETGSPPPAAPTLSDAEDSAKVAAPKPAETTAQPQAGDDPAQDQAAQPAPPKDQSSGEAGGPKPAHGPSTPQQTGGPTQGSLTTTPPPPTDEDSSSNHDEQQS